MTALALYFAFGNRIIGQIEKYPVIQDYNPPQKLGAK